MTNFEDFNLYFAKSLTLNKSTDADLFISNSLAGIKLIYCIPLLFGKRQTDTSNAQSVDKTSPDTGTAVANIELRFTYERSDQPATNIVLTLLNLFFNAGSDPIFRKGRFGLINSDNNQLDVNPTATAGYKLLNFKQDPNPDNPAIQLFTIQLDFIGDHLQLRAFNGTPT